MIGSHELSGLLNQQKQYFAASCELADTLSKVYETNRDPNHWPGAPNLLNGFQAANSLVSSAEYINNIVRSSASLVAIEQAVEPVNEAIKSLDVEVEQLIKDRNTQVIDYDSYRRRVKVLHDKKEQLQAAGKANTPAFVENNNDIIRLEGKESVAKTSYEQKNDATKKKLLDAKAQHDSLMNNFLIATVACQAELFAKAAKHLDAVLDQLPVEDVKRIRAKVAAMIEQGGPPQETIKTPKASFGSFSIKKDKDGKDSKPGSGSYALPPVSTAAPGNASSSPATVPTAAPVPAPVQPESNGNRYAKSQPPIATSKNPPVKAAVASKSNPFDTDTSFSSNPFAETGNPFGANDDFGVALDNTPVAIAQPVPAPVPAPVASNRPKGPSAPSTKITPSAPPISSAPPLAQATVSGNTGPMAVPPPPRGPPPPPPREINTYYVEALYNNAVS